MICWIPKSRGIVAKGRDDFDRTCRRVNTPAVRSMIPDVKLAVAEKHMERTGEVYRRLLVLFEENLLFFFSGSFEFFSRFFYHRGTSTEIKLFIGSDIFSSEKVCDSPADGVL